MIEFIFTYTPKVTTTILQKLLSSELLPGIISAFLGAFFAFMLHLILSAIEREKEIKKENFIASVQVEGLCARALNSMDWNIKELKNLLSNIENLLKTGPVNGYIELYKLALVHVPTGHDLLIKLILLKFLQESSNMFMMIDQLNIVIDSAMEAHSSDFREKILNKDILWDEKKRVLSFEIDRLKRLLEEFRKMREEIMKIISRTHILNPKFGKDSRGFIRKFFKSYREDYTEEEKKLMNEELNKVTKEVPEYTDPTE